MNKNLGFTLIELLLVISIISLLSTFSFFSFTEAKKKGEDSHMKAEAREVRNAIELYKLDNDGRVPGNTSGQMVQEGSSEYASAMNELVDDGYLSEVPTSPSGDSYAYMTNSDGTEGVFAASLNFESSDSSTNSCEIVETSDASFGSCTAQLEDCNTGQIDANSYCFSYADTVSGVTQYCGCGDSGIESSDPSLFPTSICQQRGFCLFGSFNANLSSATYVCSYTPSSESICDGSSNSDYCSCI